MRSPRRSPLTARRSGAWVVVCSLVVGCASTPAPRATGPSPAAPSSATLATADAGPEVCEWLTSNVVVSFEQHQTELDHQNRGLIDEVVDAWRGGSGRPVAFRVIANASHCEQQAGDDVDALMTGRAESVAAVLGPAFPRAVMTHDPAGVTVGGCPCEPSATGLCCRAQRWTRLVVRYCRPRASPRPQFLVSPA